MTIEDLDKVLSHRNIQVAPMAATGETFERIRNFLVGGKQYAIIWYPNVCTLEHGDLIIRFDHVRQSNTWPNRSRLNLQFYDERNEVCAILPIERYEGN